MELKQALVGLALTAIAISLVALPVYAGWREITARTYAECWNIFWVESYVGGDDKGTWFEDTVHDWDHGASSDPPPPWIFCYYDKEYYDEYDGQGQVTYLRTHSWGNVKLKTGEFVEYFDATAEMSA